MTGTSADCDPGTAVVIDVSGDGAVAIFSGVNAVGRNPVHATSLGGTDYAVNRDDDSVSAFILPVLGPNGQLNRPNLITLPTGAVPVFAAATQTKLFVAESGRNRVAVIDPGTNSLSQEIPVGTKPSALVATPDGTQLYSLNNGSNNATVILPANNTVFGAPISVGASPVWGAVSADSRTVFVVNQGGNSVSVINTVSNTVVGTLTVGTGPNYIVYDPILNRAYVTSPADGSISIVENATGAAPTVTIRSMAGAPCNGVTPISVTVLADGTRAYVADQAGSSVCVLNTTSNTFTKRICLVQEPATGSPPTAPCVGSATPVFIASDSSSFRVYTANQYQTAAFAISSISRQNITNPTTKVVTGVVTVTTTSSVPFVAGQPVTISGVSDFSFNGVFGITSVTAPNQFTYVQNGFTNSAAASGTAAVLPFVSLIQTSNDSLVLNGNEATDNPSLNLTTPPLTIDAGGTPTFIAMTP